MSAETAKFRDYVTSGAFKLSLSRQQVAAIAMIAETGGTDCGGHTFASLYNKGLITHIRSANDRLECRLTEAGVFALKMVRLAELTQGPTDPVAAELAALRSQLDATRKVALQLAADAWDMHARCEKADQAIAEAKAFVTGSPPPAKPLITIKNRNPQRTMAQILAHLQVAENLLEGGERVNPAASQ